MVKKYQTSDGKNRYKCDCGNDAIPMFFTAHIAVEFDGCNDCYLESLKNGKKNEIRNNSRYNK